MRFIRVGEVARLLGIGKSTVWLWVSQKRLPAPTKLSPRVAVWRLEDIESFMSEAVS